MFFPVCAKVCTCKVCTMHPWQYGCVRVPTANLNRCMLWFQKMQGPSLPDIHGAQNQMHAHLSKFRPSFSRRCVACASSRQTLSLFFQNTQNKQKQSPTHVHYPGPAVQGAAPRAPHP